MSDIYVGHGTITLSCLDSKLLLPNEFNHYVETSEQAMHCIHVHFVLSFIIFMDLLQSYQHLNSGCYMCLIRVKIIIIFYAESIIYSRELGETILHVCTENSISKHSLCVLVICTGLSFWNYQCPCVNSQRDVFEWRTYGWTAFWMGCFK